MPMLKTRTAGSGIGLLSGASGESHDPPSGKQTGDAMTHPAEKVERLARELQNLFWNRADWRCVAIFILDREAKLVEALKKYGKHETSGCGYASDVPNEELGKCQCGFDSALKQAGVEG